MAASQTVPDALAQPAPEGVDASGTSSSGSSVSVGSPDHADSPSAKGSFFELAPARDAIAWVRLLADPADAAAAVRALGRPPVEMRQVDIARVVQLSRKHKLDMVAALGLALESPQLPPEARERIARFLELHDRARAALDRIAPQLRVTPGELAAQLGAAADGRLLEGAAPGEPPLETLQASIEALREEVLGGAARIAGRLGELRLDTDLDISHGVVRYLELVKLNALRHRPPGQPIREALADINVRLLAACTPLQREIFQTSTLDEALIAAEGAGGAHAGSALAGPGGVEAGAAQATADAPSADAAMASPAAVAPRRSPTAGTVAGPPTFARREEPSLQGFIPKKGEGLVLSASDIETYRSCPLRYKFARVLKVPSPQTLGQRFGIAVHQVLERYHQAGHTTLAQMLELLEQCWRRGGFGESESERQLRTKARAALGHYHERLAAHESEPVWFERQFAFTLGAHHIRGRVDRVDRLPDGAYELIDYKTSRPRTAEQLAHDVQLSLYATAARESWQVTAERLSYYYVLDDLKVPVPSDCLDPDWIAGVVAYVGEAIRAQRFEPTPSPGVCALCDYRIACPAGDR